MIDLSEATIPELQAAMGRRELSARELVFFYLGRIARLDSCAGGLNAVLEVNPDALFIADMLDAERQRGRLRGPLHGVPIMLKDSINTADRMHTSAGSLALAGNLAPYDAHVVTRLREAGAIILGKANMTELANFMGENMPAGYSSRGGQVLSPFNRARSPAGSSSGSAVAVAARLCAASLGTENFGSIHYPAQCNGIVGLKPTMGLVSRYGNVPTTHTLDTIGPMTATVMDAAILLGAIAGRDEQDPATWTRGTGESTDYTSLLDRGALRGARIGLDRAKSDALTGERRSAFGRLLAAIEGAGATLVGIEDIGGIISESEIDPVFFCEHKSCMNAYLATLRPGMAPATLQEIIDFNERHADRALRYGQPILLQVQNETTGGLTEPAYLGALQKRKEAVRALDAVFGRAKLDVLLGQQPETIAPIAGFPSLSIPLGSDEEGMPFGAYWIARRYEEATLLRLGHAAEALLGVRCRPAL